MSRAVLSVGSNLDDAAEQLRRAARALVPWTVTRSSMYATKPWGPIVQADFLNAVLVVDDDAATPQTWLHRAHEAERAAGRRRDQRYGPRTLDVDVISVDDVCSDDPVLTLPHPHAADRAFVLVPWLEIEPAAELPGAGSVAALLARLSDADRSSVLARLDLNWDG